MMDYRYPVQSTFPQEVEGHEDSQEAGLVNTRLGVSRELDLAKGNSIQTIQTQRKKEGEIEN
jgi:hypothetical protein